MTTEIDPSRYETLKISKTDGIVTVTLNNPARKNAVSRKMHLELERVWDDIDADYDARVAILTGEGDAFCSGIDLSGINEENETGSRARPRTRGARRLFWNMLDCETPIIARVRGVAYGLGASIALASDIVIAEEGARFCDSHVKAGIAPGDGGASLWPLLIGFHRAKEFIMTGDPVDASRAAEMGLINYCKPAEEFDAFVQQMARKLADGAPLAISYGKLAVNSMLKQLMAGSFETSMAYDQLTLYTNDHKEGAAAFMEKRKPKFTGS
jgi:enoyl-CoA hydratase